MKTKQYFVGVGIAILNTVAGDVSAESVVFKESPTNEQVILARRQADGQDPTKHLAVKTGEDPSVVHRPTSLLADSDIICYRGYATLVPKRAIVKSPKNLADRIKMQPGATLQSWSDFYAANRGWITTVEVSKPQSKGVEPIAKEVQVQVEKSSNLIVATYLGGPVSMMPQKVVLEPTPTQPKP
jgi:hypothetical protein